MTEQPDYRAFLEAKVKLASQDGFAIDPEAVNPAGRSEWSSQNHLGLVA